MPFVRTGLRGLEQQLPFFLVSEGKAVIIVQQGLRGRSDAVDKQRKRRTMSGLGDWVTERS